MTNKEAIKYLTQIYPHGGGTWLDEQRIEAINMAINALEEPVSEDLDEASRNYADNEEYGDDIYFAIKVAYKEGANWQKKQDINKACDAYCQICGHYAHCVPTYICRQNCQYYTDFRKAME